MVIHVRHGKGGRDRYVMLSEQLLAILRAYWKRTRSQHWVFPGSDPARPITARSLQRACRRGVQAAGLDKRVTVHTLRHERADVSRRHGEAWREAQAGHLSRVQLRVMSAIESCRTAALGGHVEQCVACAHTRIAYNSCRNRHCPKCQGSAASAWLAARTAELLPVPYFHVVFTLPAQLGAIAYQNKALVYGLLFKVAAETLTTIAADPKRLGARIGVTAVLHTWGQTLDHHPHVHCIVPGGGLSPDGARWIPCRSGFFLPVRVLSRLFRRLFLDRLPPAPPGARRPPPPGAS